MIIIVLFRDGKWYCLKGDECRAHASICVWSRSNVTIQRYSFCETSKNFTFYQRQSPVYRVFFWGVLLSLDVSTIPWTLRFAYRTMFSRFFTFIPTDDRSNQPLHFDRMFSQTFYKCNERTNNIKINTCIK